MINLIFFFFSSRRRHTICYRDWSSDVCSSDLDGFRRRDRQWRARPRPAPVVRGASVRDGFDLAQRREPAQGLDLDLPNALSGQAEPPPDLLECLRLVVGEPVPQHEDLALAVAE